MEKTVYNIKLRFLSIIDGGYDFQPLIEGLDSFKLGICKLIYYDNVLHVYLRRPGILIGKKGETINLLSKELGYKIVVHTVNLLN